MNSSGLYVRSDNGHVITHEHRQSVMLMLKILYRLDIVTEKQVLDIATKFQSLFV
jgi:hypothetical protein